MSRSFKERVKAAFSDPRELPLYFISTRPEAFAWIPDKPYLKLLYRLRMGKKLNLDHPTAFNEKLQWLKLYNRKSEYTAMVDKFTAKQYVTEKIGEEYIIPTLGVWDTFDQIDFDKLPSQFVLKCTHDSGGLVICRDQSRLNLTEVREKINKSLKKKYYCYGREWPYKHVKPRIIAEAFMEDATTQELRDYKFFCFDGVPKALFIATDRQSKTQDTKFDFFDMDYNHLNIKNGHENADIPPEKPKMFEKMQELAAKLSAGIPHLRVDFYEVNCKIYFGELTFFNWSGLQAFEPEEWDEKLGSWITLPEVTEEKDS